MKKTMTKIAALLMAVVFATILFAGCGKKAPDGKFLIGGIGPLTGDYAQYGNAVKNGMALAIEEINAKGGVNGIMFELKFEDDVADGEQAVNAYRSLKDSGMDVFIGSVTSGSCQAVQAEAVVDNMFLLTPSGSSITCIEGDNAFRVCFNDDNQGLGSADYIAANGLAKKVAVIYDSSSTYSTGIYQSFKKEAAKLGKFEVFDTNTSFTSETNKNFDAQLQAVKASGADLVFLPIYYTEASLIIKAAETVLPNVKFFGCDGLDGIFSQFSDKDGNITKDAEILQGVMLLTPFVADAADAKTQAFTNAFVAKFGETPIQFAADGYDAVYAVKAAMEKANVTSDDISVSDLCNLLKKAMTEIEVDGVTGKMTWDASGEPQKEPKAMYIDVTSVDGNYNATYKAAE